MDSKDVITLIVAGYAAVVSTVTLLWNIIKWRWESGRIHVAAKFVRAGDNAERHSVIITVTNTGRQPASSRNLSLCELLSF